MPQQQEQTFGSILRRLQDLVLRLSEFANYNPPNPNDVLSELQSLVARVQDANIAEAEQFMDYNIAMEARKKDFSEDEFCVDKVLTYIRSMVAATYGEKSQICKVVARHIRKMRGVSKKQKESQEDEGENEVEALDATTDVPNLLDAVTEVSEEPAEEAKSPSQSHRSYGSLAASFLGLVTMLGRINYNPSKPELQLARLQAFAAGLNVKNDQVKLKEGALEMGRKDRNELYEDAMERMKRVKSYVKVAYGKNSHAYLLVKGL